MTNETEKAGALDVDALANEIRRVDGSNKLGAGALAEALIPFLRASQQAPNMALHGIVVGRATADSLKASGFHGYIVDGYAAPVEGLPSHVPPTHWYCGLARRDHNIRAKHDRCPQCVQVENMPMGSRARLAALENKEKE